MELNRKEAEFLAPLPLSAMPGIGKVTERELKRLGFVTLGEIAKASDALLESQFGAWGRDLKQMALGIDDAPLREGEETKSIGRETTFEEDAGDVAYLLSVLSSFTEECCVELRSHGFKARTVTVKCSGRPMIFGSSVRDCAVLAMHTGSLSYPSFSMDLRTRSAFYV